MRYQLSILTMVLLSVAGVCHAQTAPSAADERARIRHERQVVEQALAQAEAACYQRFAVEDCLRQARQTARKAQTELRQQEAVINEAERRQRAAQRLEDIAERERTHPVPALMPPRIKEVPPTAQPSENTAAAPRPAETQAEKEKEAAKNAAVLAEREQQARQRARQQQQKRKAHKTNQAESVSAQAAEAANARQQREAKQAAAAQRRARLLQSQAEAAAAGHVPAAPLSPVP